MLQHKKHNDTGVTRYIKIPTKNLTSHFRSFKMELSRGGQAHNATPGAASPEHTNAGGGFPLIKNFPIFN
jgi:hypothetical protein